MFALTRFCYIEVLFHMFYFYWGRENRSLYQGVHYIEVCFQNNGNCKISLLACHANTVKLFFPSQLKKVRHILLLSGTKRDDDDAYFCILPASNLAYSQESS